MNLPLNTFADVHDATAQARFNMIEQQIRPWNVLDERVLDTLARVRREDFVPPAYQGMAFADVEIPVFAHANPLALGVVRGVLRLARPVLDSPRFAANRGWVFRGRVIQRRLDELSRGD